MSVSSVSSRSCEILEGSCFQTIKLYSFIPNPGLVGTKRDDICYLTLMPDAHVYFNILRGYDFLCHSECPLSVLPGLCTTHYRVIESCGSAHLLHSTLCVGS